MDVIQDACDCGDVDRGQTVKRCTLESSRGPLGNIRLGTSSGKPDHGTTGTIAMFRISSGGASMHSSHPFPLVLVAKALRMFPYLEALIVVCVYLVNHIYSAGSH